MEGMKPTRRSLLTGFSALALTPACGTGAKREGGSDTGDPSEPQPDPVRSAEPDVLWEPSGDVDLEAFPSGVQVGDVMPDAALLSVWTSEDEVTVELAAADGEGWTPVGVLLTLTRSGVCAQGELTGLEADTAYCVVVSAGGRRSAVSRFRTALAPDASRQLTIGATSCLHSNHPWKNMSAVAALKPDAFLFLGDTVYADGAEDLDGYRWFWERALTTQGMIDVTASTSVIATWDDHEVTNDFEGLRTPEARVEAALTAFREGLPQRIGGLGGLWRKLSWGRAADIFVLDGRGERDGEEQYLSPAQMEWLKTELEASNARFKLIMNSVPITDYAPIFAQALVRDRWQGYPEQRREILDHIVANDLQGVLWITGDFHMCTASRLDSAEGLASDLWEIMVGPGGSFLNIAAQLVEPSDQFPVIFAEYCSTVIHLDPGTGLVQVEWVGDDGEVIESVEINL